MIKYRNHVFETNSSSSHAIIVKTQSTPAKIEIPDWKISENGELHVFSNYLEFGRSPFELLTDWEGRVRYAIASFGTDEKLEEIEEICRRYVPGFKRFVLDKYDPYGYVDHQSQGLLEGFLDDRSISLEDFLFDDRYIVVIDGDEYCVLDSVLESGIVDRKSIERIYD